MLFSEFDGFDLGSTAPVTGVHIRNLRLVGNAGEGIGVAEGSEALLVCGMEIVGFDLGLHFPQITETTSDVTVRESEFVQNRNEAIQGGANDLQILSSTFVENGFRRIPRSGLSISRRVC